MTISLAITTYNRPDLTLQSFAKVIDDPRISEVVIVDDCSSSIVLLLEATTHSKIIVHRNAANIGMSRNKARAISLCSNEWVIILDSDNVIGTDYLDALEAMEPYFDKDVIFAPSKALPNFDFSQWEGMTFDHSNVPQMMGNDKFKVLLNTCNYIVHRDAYARVYKYDESVRGNDTISFAYEWFKAGNMMHIVPGMTYQHRVHKGSEWLKHSAYNLKQVKEIEKKLMEL